jgi:hypothetical protein
VAVNVPLLALVPIVILDGTLSAVTSRDRVTVAMLEGALVSVTVQVALCPLPSMPGEQLTADTCAADTRLNENVRETLFALAVITAV